MTVVFRFIKNDPGRQIITGSFRPIDVGDWAREAYNLLPGETLASRNAYGLLPGETLENVHALARDSRIDYESLWARHTFKNEKLGAIYTQDRKLFGPDGFPIEIRPFRVSRTQKHNSRSFEFVGGNPLTDENATDHSELEEDASIRDYDGKQSEGTSGSLLATC